MARRGFKRLSDKLHSDEPARVQKGRSEIERHTRTKESARPISDDDSTRQVLGVLEVGYLALAADGEVKESEISALSDNLARWVGQDLRAEALADLLTGFSRDLKREGFEERLTRLSEVLDPDLRRVAFDLASAVAVCDGDVHKNELGLLTDIARVFEISHEEANARFDVIYQATEEA